MGHPGGLLDPPGCLLGGSCSLLGSWRPLSAPLEAPWSALGELLGWSWRCLGGSWRVLGGVWRPFGSLLEASWRQRWVILRRFGGVLGHPGASWRALEASLERLGPRGLEKRTPGACNLKEGSNAMFRAGGELVMYRWKGLPRHLRNTSPGLWAAARSRK